MLPYIIIGMIAAIVAAILLTPVGVSVVYDEKLTVTARVGPIKFQVYPVKKTAKKEKKPKEKEKQAKPKKKHSSEEIKALISELLPPVKNALSKTGRALRIDLLRLNLTVGGESPAKAAERYGAANAIIWTVVPQLENAVRIKRRDINIFLNYGAKSSTFSGAISLHIRVWAGAAMMFTVGIPVLKAVIKFSRSGKPEEEKKDKAA